MDVELRYVTYLLTYLLIVTAHYCNQQCQCPIRLVQPRCTLFLDSNFGPILLRFRDIIILEVLYAKVHVFNTLPYSGQNFIAFPLE